MRGRNVGTPGAMSSIQGVFNFTLTSFTLNQGVLGSFKKGYPISGTASVSRKQITFSGSGQTTGGQPYTASGTIVRKVVRGKTQLIITYRINIFGIPTRFTATVS